MKFFQNNFISLLRAIHRDLGYFVVGMTFVYAISGILLNHMNGQDPAVGKTIIKKQFSPLLDKENFKELFRKQIREYKLNTIINDGKDYKIYVNGGTGIYHSVTGKLKLEIVHNRPFVEFINKLHYNQKKGWTFFADFFAAALIVLALSGLFIVKGKNGFMNRGVWITALGIAVVLFYFWI